ncbi:MAG: Ig-like domain-containing protein [Muribaculaceae bacterium]|nr:Ig-like domain-containing protein [Muribaculaceae bacterium]MDE6643936.1 Ig-like domain-containing protein [Muribaculaceae bacterium]
MTAETKTITENICGLDFQINIDTNNNTADITSWRVEVKDASLAANVVIPESIIYDNENYTIVSLDQALRACGAVYKVTLPNSIKNLKDRAFASCNNLVSVQLGNGITTLPQYLFQNCRLLESVVIPNSVSTIENYVFINCNSLKSLRIPASVVNISDQAFGAALTAIEDIYLENPNAEVYPETLFNIVMAGEISPWNGNPNVKIHVPEESLPAFVARYKSVFSADHFVALKPIAPDLPPTLELSETSLELSPGESFQLTATVIPQPTEEMTITWISSDEAVVKVLADGTLQAIGVGTATVKATAGELSAECQVEVVPIKVESFLIKGIYATDVYFMGRSYQAVVEVTPENATDKTVVWSSNKPELATVNEIGLVNCLNEGEVTITATIGSLSRSVKIQIKPIQLQSITLSPEIMELTVGQEGALSWTTTPSDATFADVEWRISNTAVAIVQDNVVKALAGGETRIQAFNLKNGIWSNECKVVVKRADGDMLILSSGNITLMAKETFQLSVLNDPNGLADLVWSSDNRDVATVDENGLVKAVGKGETVIRAVCEDRVGECIVTVNTIDATEIQLSETAIELHPGQSTTIDALIIPDNVTDNTVVWSTDNPSAAKVDNGFIEAVGEGVATITARCGDVIAECIVTVTIEKIAIESVNINELEITLEIGDIRQLSFTVQPENAYYESIEWKSTNENVVTVNRDGLVSAVGVGEAFVSVGVDAVAAICKIKVVKAQMSGIEEVPQNPVTSQITTLSNTIMISNLKHNDFVGVYSVNGTAVYPPSNVVTDALTVRVPSPGIYIVRINKNATKVAVR